MALAVEEVRGQFVILRKEWSRACRGCPGFSAGKSAHCRCVSRLRVFFVGLCINFDCLTQSYTDFSTLTKVIQPFELTFAVSFSTLTPKVLNVKRTTIPNLQSVSQLRTCSRKEMQTAQEAGSRVGLASSSASVTRVAGLVRRAFARRLYTGSLSC